MINIMADLPKEGIVSAIQAPELAQEEFQKRANDAQTEIAVILEKYEVLIGAQLVYDPNMLYPKIVYVNNKKA